MLGKESHRQLALDMLEFFDRHLKDDIIEPKESDAATESGAPSGSR